MFEQTGAGYEVFVNAPEKRVDDEYAFKGSLAEAKFAVRAYKMDYDKATAAAERDGKPENEAALRESIHTMCDEIEEIDNWIRGMLMTRGQKMASVMVAQHALKCASAQLPKPLPDHMAWTKSSKDSWAPDELVLCECISNLAFRARVSIEKVVSDSYRTQGKVWWRCKTELITNRTFTQNQEVLKDTVHNCDSLEEAQKYIKGRKKWLEKNFFCAELPVIPERFAAAFCIQGAKLPIYTYEG